MNGNGSGSRERAAEAVRQGVQDTFEEYLDEYGDETAFHVEGPARDEEEEELKQVVQEHMPTMRQLLDRPWFRRYLDRTARNVLFELIEREVV